MAGWNGSNIEQLRAMTADQLFKIQTELTLKVPGGITPVAPVIDGKILPMPLEAVKAGSAPGTKILIGTNLDEWKLFELMAPKQGELTDELLAKGLEQMIAPQKVAKLIAAYRSGLSKRGGTAKPADIMSAIRTDMMFRMPSVRFLEARCQNRQESYAYLFTWQSPAMNGAFGACHALEIGFVFCELDSSFSGSGPDADKLSYEIQEAWTTFARTGNPSTNSLGPWPQYCEKRSTMILGKISHLEEAPYDEERAIWDEIEGV
jgi:para-nitrobenzyl esterase